MTAIARRERVIVGLSGGVDSAVSAHLLCEQGFEVQGLFMKNWEDDDSNTQCAAAQDLDDAKQVCDVLGIALHQVNFARQYRQEVFERFLSEYRAGRTPNPDVLCNQRIKFRAFVDYALRLGADRVATGHYAGIDDDSARWRLLRGADANKDQSYFLYTLGQEQLARALFPLARLHKPRVREIGEELGFDNCDKKDSTGICFIGERDFRGFLGRYIETSPGEMITPEGATVGTHRGLAFYTIGQRRGLEIGGRAGHGAEPWYVVDKDTAANCLVVAQGHDHPLLMSDALEAGQLCWVSGRQPLMSLRCTAKTRYRQLDQLCTVETGTGARVRVRFDQPQWAVAPGQSVVFYDGDVCLGGGVIECRYQALREEPMRGSA